MINTEYMNEDEKALYRRIYNQKNLVRVVIEHDHMELVFQSDGIQYVLRVNLPWDITLNYLGSLGRTRFYTEDIFFHRIVERADEKHTISEKNLRYLVDRYLSIAYSGENKVPEITKVYRNMDNKKEFELEAYTENGCTFRENYGIISQVWR